MRILLFVFACSFLSINANADSGDFYVGLGPSVFAADVDSYSRSDFDQITGFSTNNALRTVADNPADGGSASWRVYAGYQFTDVFALELGYLDSLGEFERSANRNSNQTYSIPLIGTLPLIECSTEEYEASAFTVSVVGQLDWLYGRVGAAFYDIDTTTRTGLIRGGLFSGFGTTRCSVSGESSSESATGLVVAAGARFDFDSWAIRAELEMLNGIEFSSVGEATHYGLSLTAEKRF